MEAALASRDPTAAFTLERAALVAVLGDHKTREEAAIVYPLRDDHLPDAPRARWLSCGRSG
ncbi:MAG: hypothetical protein HS111_02435 [Kofleriaceae bacterium]|nr:hypothetical protein [Kofleriaceae bacterium]